MNEFINDELINIIYFFINYYNNNFIRNLWFLYIDYFNINSSVYILSLTIMVLFIISLYIFVQLYKKIRFNYLYFQILLCLEKYH